LCIISYVIIKTICIEYEKWKYINETECKKEYTNFEFPIYNTIYTIDKDYIYSSTCLPVVGFCKNVPFPITSVII